MGSCIIKCSREVESLYISTNPDLESSFAESITWHCHVAQVQESRIRKAPKQQWIT